MGRFNDRTGETNINFQGYKMTVVKYRNSNDIDVQFNDELNTIYQHKKYLDFKRGKIKNINYLVGLKNKSNQGYEMIIMGGNAMNLDIRLDDGTILHNIRKELFDRGMVDNPNCKSLYNIGYMGIGKYNSVNYPLIYQTWSGMLERCYNTITQEKHPTYIDCKVDSYFHNFQNFAKWYEENLWNNDCTILDKDLLIKGNKIYSQDTCSLVDRKLNNMLLKPTKNKGIPIGVVYHKRDDVYEVKCDGEYIGRTNNPIKGFYIYKKQKEKNIKQVANEYKEKYPNFPERLYQALINYEVEITD